MPGKGQDMEQTKVIPEDAAVQKVSQKNQPVRRNNRFVRLRKFLIWLLVFVITASVLFGFWHLAASLNSSSAEKRLKGIYEQYTSTEQDETFDVPASVDLAGLARQKGISAVGFLKCDALDLMEPVMQGTDNLVYRGMLPDGTKSSTGSLFLDAGENAGLTDNNLILYGTNAKLNRLRMLSNASGTTHEETLYLYTGNDIRQYQVVSVHPLKSTYDTLSYGDIDINNLMELEEKRSRVVTVNRMETDQLLTLVCLPGALWQEPVVMTFALLGTSGGTSENA